MPGTARREHFGFLLEPGLSDIFYNTLEQIPSIRQEIFNIQSTDQPTEIDVSIGSMANIPRFEGQITYDRPYQQYKKIYEFPEYAGGFQIERKLWDDDRYSIINQRPAALAISMERTREEYAASLFDNAFNPTVTGPDGKPLCADDHPTKSPDGPAARSNLGHEALSHDSLQETKRLMRQFVDDRGNKVSVVPDTLIVPVELEEIAWELIQSDKKIDTAENNPNIHEGRYRLIVWDFLSSPTNWFLCDSRYMKLFLKWFDRVPPEFAMEEEFDTLVAKFRVYARWEAGWSDWFWLFGHEVE